MANKAVPHKRVMKFLPFGDKIRNFPPRPDESMVHLANEDIVGDLRQCYYAYTDEGLRIQHHDQLNAPDQLEVRNEPSSTFEFLLEAQEDKNSTFYKSMAKLRDKIKGRDHNIIVGRATASSVRQAEIVDIGQLKEGDFVAVYAQKPSLQDRNKKAHLIWGSQLGYWICRVEHLYGVRESRQIATLDPELYPPGERGPIAKVRTIHRKVVCIRFRKLIALFSQLFGV